MLTTSHWIIWYLLFKGKWKAIWKYSVIWAVLPDIPMLVSLTVFYTYILISWDKEISHIVLHEQFIGRLLSPVMHSIFLWLLILSFVLFVKNKLIKTKIIALWIWWMSHVGLDFLTHRWESKWNHLYPLDFQPVEGIFYYLNPYFIIFIHIIWLIIFWPKIYKYFKRLRL